MPNHGASYPSREWNISVDGFSLLQWQPAPLLNTLWKQFLLCNAGESQQIINLSQHSPSARKYKSKPSSCTGNHTKPEKHCQGLIIASALHSAVRLWFGVSLLFSTFKTGAPLPPSPWYHLKVWASERGPPVLSSFSQVCYNLIPVSSSLYLINIYVCHI